MVLFERATVVSYRLSIVTIALSLTIQPHLPSNVSDAQINWGGKHFEAKFGEEGSTNVSQMLTRSGREMRLSYAKVKISSATLAVHNAQTCQTDRQTATKER